MVPRLVTMSCSRALRNNKHYLLSLKRAYSTPTKSHHDSIIQELKSREPTTTFDYMTSTPTHLLNVALADFLPRHCIPGLFGGFNRLYDLLPNPSLQNGEAVAIPFGYHTVYFPPMLPDSKLLPDGTDAQHSPGEPYDTRLWAGGSIITNTQLIQGYDRRMQCVEDISDVEIKGPAPHEKVWVKVRRKIGPSSFPDKVYLEETRNVVFMKENSDTSTSPRASGAKAPPKSDFSISLTPTPSLLFRFSALTFNAHKIHLDPTYCREVEGHRGLLVHGPLSLVMMLNVVRSRLKPREFIKRFDYKNFAPLYVGEEMKICILTEGPDTIRVWIETPDGRMAVRGTAILHGGATRNPIIDSSGPYYTKRLSFASRSDQGKR